MSVEEQISYIKTLIEHELILIKARINELDKTLIYLSKLLPSKSEDNK